MENGLLYVLGVAAVAIALFACVLPQLNYADLIGAPDLKQTFRAWSFIDGFEDNLHWNAIGNAGDYGVNISTTYAHYQTHSLKVSTRLTSPAVDDWTFAAYYASLGSTAVIETDLVVMSGFFCRWYPTQDKYVQFEFIINNGTHTIPACVQFDVLNDKIRAKTTDYAYVNISDVDPDFTYSAWCYFELSANYTSGYYERFRMKGDDADINVDMSSIQMNVEEETLYPTMAFYVGVQCAVSYGNAVCYFEDIMCQAMTYGEM